MSTAESVSPIFYILFGAFLALVGIHFWRYLRQRFAARSMDTRAKAFTVRLIDGIRTYRVLFKSAHADTPALYQIGIQTIAEKQASKSGRTHFHHPRQTQY